MNFPEIVACSRLALQQEGRLLYFDRGIPVPSPTLAWVGGGNDTSPSHERNIRQVSDSGNADENSVQRNIRDWGAEFGMGSVVRESACEIAKQRLSDGHILRNTAGQFTRPSMP